MLHFINPKQLFNFVKSTIIRAHFYLKVKIGTDLLAYRAELLSVLFLPPYSPDLNPIEHHWAAVKNAIRKAAEGAKCFYEAAVNILGEMCVPSCV